MEEVIATIKSHLDQGVLLFGYFDGYSNPQATAPLRRLAGRVDKEHDTVVEDILPLNIHYPGIR